MQHLAIYAPILPELALVGGAMALLMLGVFRKDDEATASLVTWLAIAVIVAAAFLVIRQPGPAQALFDGAFVVDRFARFMKVLTLVGAAVALILSIDYLREARIHRFEFPVLVLLATTGMMMMISAGDLIALYIGLELQSLSLYVLAAWRRDSVHSSEAGLKYFVLGALSSGMLLYGASLVYGFTGSVQFARIAAVTAQQGAGDSIGLIIGLVFVLVGLAFKISAVPFHMWTPDVYEGAPTPVTAFFAAAPKMAAMALLARVLLTGFPSLEIVPKWQQIIVFLAIASMLLGAFAAIGQTNIKRLMAYSSIGHVGFALVGLASGTVEGTSGLVVYLAIYLVMTLGAFAAILSMRRADGMVEDISELAGLATTNLSMAVMLGFLLFSLAGIPWLAGFFAKFYVFAAAIKAGLYPLAIIGVLASCVAAYYYLRIVKIMFMDEPKDAFLPVPTKAGFVLAAASFLVTFYVLYPSPLVVAAEAAARSFTYR